VQHISDLHSKKWRRLGDEKRRRNIETTGQKYNECQPKGGDALRLESKGRYGLFAGRTVCCHDGELWKTL